MENQSIEIYDTSLRDGAQSVGVEFSLADKINLTQRLDDIGVDYVEGGYPLSNDKDRQYFEHMRACRLRHAKVVAFGMTRRRDMKCSNDPGMAALLSSEAPVITIVGKTWDLHVTEILGATLEQNLEMIFDTVRYLHDQGRQVFYDAEHFFDGYRANPGYAMKTLQAARDGGATTVILCDTNGGSLPENVGIVVARVHSESLCRIGIHCHNDCELAVANSLAAVDNGATQVQGTVNGIGERCGNADLISVVGNLALKKGRQVLGGTGTCRLKELSRYLYDMINSNPRDGQPFVGAHAFAHKGGMHVHAVNKLACSYEHIEPSLVGNERRIVMSELGGRSNVAKMLERLGKAFDAQLVKRLSYQVQLNEADGYQYDSAEASFALLALKEAGLFTPHFERIRSFERVEATGAISFTEATLKLRVGSHDEHVVGEGDGPVNAIDLAMRRALIPHFPTIKNMRLVDYRVRVVTRKEEGTAAPVRVLITSADSHDHWTTVGVDKNIVEASWIALVDSFEYKLYKDAKAFG